jgi:lipopolysaccharide export system protein LptA
MLRYKISLGLGINPVVIFLLLDGLVSAQITPNTSTSLITITSKTMTVKSHDRIAVFDHDVVVNKGDLTITADHVKITFKPSMGEDSVGGGVEPVLPGSQFEDKGVSELYAWGNVILQDGTRRAESREALYDQKGEKVILLGDPVVFEKGYQISGVKMTIFLKDNSSVIEGSKVLIDPEEMRKP